MPTPPDRSRVCSLPCPFYSCGSDLLTSRGCLFPQLILFKGYVVASSLPGCPKTPAKRVSAPRWTSPPCLPTGFYWKSTKLKTDISGTQLDLADVWVPPLRQLRSVASFCLNLSPHRRALFFLLVRTLRLSKLRRCY